MDNYNTQNTHSGLRVLVVKRPKNPKLVHIQYVLGIGSDLESGRQLEISHFLEHLFVSLTSSKYPDSKTNREFFSRNNINYNASIGTKNTIHEFSFRKTKLDLFLDLLINAIVDYRVDKNIFLNEKNSIIEELNEIIDDVNYNLDTYTDSMIYRGHNRTQSQKQRLSNSHKMTAGQIQTFWNKYYKHPYSVLSVYGAIDIKNLVKKINEIEKAIKTKHKIGSPLEGKSLIKLYKPYKIRNESKLLFLKKDDSISTLKIGWRVDMNIFSNEFYKIYALDYILINDLNSLLLKKLRTELGLIYDIESSFELDEIQNDLSVYFFQTTVSSKKLLKVISSFMEVIDYLVKNQIKDENYKKYLETQEQISLERNENIDFTNVLSNYSRNYLWKQKIVTQSQEDKNYINLTKQDILTISQKIFTTNNLYISYASNQNLNKKINQIIDKQDF